jgi:hypothetical protein
MSLPVVGLTLRPIAGNGRPPYLMQCHPEDLYAGHECARRLFRAFVSASSGG